MEGHFFDLNIYRYSSETFADQIDKQIFYILLRIKFPCPSSLVSVAHIEGLYLHLSCWQGYYGPFTLQMIYTVVRSLTQWRNSLPGCVISSEI